MVASSTGKVLSIAIRTAVRGPMREVPSASAVVDGGIHGDIPVETDRGVTFLSSEQWRDVTRELGIELPWHTRRANVLIEGLALPQLKGRRIRVGGAEVLLLDETRPCGLMDAQHAGLRKALIPDCRGGLHGRVVAAGVFRVGDSVVVLEGEPADKGEQR